MPIIPSDHRPREQSLLEEEALDLRDPLRHLMHASSIHHTSLGDNLHGNHSHDANVQNVLLHSSSEDTIVPEQPPSTQNQLIQLSFPNPQYLPAQGASLESTSPSSGPDDCTPINKVVIELVVDAKHGCGGIAWPAGEVLSNYLIYKGPKYLQSKTIVELGAGTGLVGLVAAQLGAKNVWVTDQLQLIDIMRQNVSLNDLDTSVTTAELNWGQPIVSPVPQKPDIILAADCVYFEPAFPLLVQTLVELSTPETDILFAYKKRRKADSRFFKLLKKHFSWTEAVDDPGRPIYTREAITLLKLSLLKRK